MRYTTEDHKEHGVSKIQCIYITQVCLEAGWLELFSFSSPHAMFVNNQLAWSASYQLGFLTISCYVDVSVSFNTLSGMPVNYLAKVGVAKCITLTTLTLFNEL